MQSKNERYFIWIKEKSVLVSNWMLFVYEGTWKFTIWGKKHFIVFEETYKSERIWHNISDELYFHQQKMHSIFITLVPGNGVYA